MSNYSPITPPDELYNQWFDNWRKNKDLQIIGCDFYIATQAAQWGADQELKACAEWVGSMFHGHKTWADELLNARRPKPPSLKEQALAELEILSDYAHGLGCSESAIRRALEQLDD